MGSIFLRNFVCQANSLASSALISNDLLLFTILSLSISGHAVPHQRKPNHNCASPRQVPYGVPARTILRGLASESAAILNLEPRRLLRRVRSEAVLGNDALNIHFAHTPK